MIARRAGGGNRETVLSQLVGNADLTEGRLLDRQRYDGILDLLWHAVLQHRLLAADFLQRQFATLVVGLFEPVDCRGRQPLRHPPRERTLVHGLEEKPRHSRPLRSRFEGWP